MSSSSVVQTDKNADFAESRNALDDKEFLEFLKDDVRPFVQYLLHTRIFKVCICVLFCLVGVPYYSCSVVIMWLCVMYDFIHLCRVCS